MLTCQLDHLCMLSNKLQWNFESEHINVPSVQCIWICFLQCWGHVWSCLNVLTHFGPVMPYDAIRQHRSGSTLAQVMACCLMAPSHYLSRYWLIIIEVLWHSPLGNFTGTLQWHHNQLDGISNHRSLDCLLNRLFRRRSKKASKLHVTGLCEGNPPGLVVSPKRASNAENVSIWWHHHEYVFKNH